MNLLIDSGNTSTKAAIYQYGKAITFFKPFSFEEIEKIKLNYSISRVIISSVNKDYDTLKASLPDSLECIILTSDTPLPVRVNYSTPQTLGPDRIAAACGAHLHYPDQHCLIIDAGTCITYDFLHRTEGYLGGSISPGIEMRFKALNAYTSRLPLLQKTIRTPLTGKNTEQSILSGVLNGVLQEAKGIITEYQLLYNPLKIIVTGGDTDFFETNLKPTIFAIPNLVFDGLNSILEYNVHKV
ncbi:MAG: type III pantothenate kinase [Cytophagaceae bacterium]|nr:type III pantothenate kinase [Cytophagaceae bacterium]MDW8456167.1 type III pantothenate kinase [Cytophagaceae bacterium]